MVIGEWLNLKNEGRETVKMFEHLCLSSLFSRRNLFMFTFLITLSYTSLLHRNWQIIAHNYSAANNSLMYMQRSHFSGWCKAYGLTVILRQWRNLHFFWKEKDTWANACMLLLIIVRYPGPFILLECCSALCSTQQILLLDWIKSHQ